MTNDLEIYFLENNVKRGPIKIIDIPNHNINIETLIWFEGQDKWMKIIDLRKDISPEIYSKIAPQVPDSNIDKIRNGKKTFSKALVKVFKKLIKVLCILLILSPIIYFIRLYTDNEYNLYQKFLNNHHLQYNHSKKDLCSFGEIPEFIDKSKILEFKNDSEYYNLTKEQMFNEIYKLDKSHYNYLVRTNDTRASFYPFYNDSDVNEIYNSIQCVYHNRSITYMDWIKNDILRESILMSFGIIIIFYFIFFLVNSAKSIIKYNRE